MAIADAPARHSGPFTYHDLPTEPDDGLRYELIDGALIVTPAPTTAHQRAHSRLFALLIGAAPAETEVFSAPYDWKVSDLTVVQPDLLLVRTADLGEKNLQTAPLLAVEILSPSTRRIDLGLKLDAYRDAGLRHYWTVDVDAPSVTAHDFNGDGRSVTATGDETFAVDTPVALSFTISSLIRR